MTLSLSAQPRTKIGSHACNKLRKEGLVPAVVYGAGAASQPISLSANEFEKVWREAGESTVIELAGLDGDKVVLIHEVAVDPLMGAPTHVDLYAVSTDKKVEVSVPITFTGVASAEKQLGGTLIKVMRELYIEALPKDLPHSIEVDITPLETFEDAIHIKDLKLPNGVTTEHAPEEVVALVQEANAVEEEPTVEADLSEIEVEQKGKEESAQAEEKEGA